MSDPHEDKLRDIPIDEWRAHDWIDVSTYRSGPVFLRRTEKPQPPDDGFAYVPSYNIDTNRMEWMRAKTSARPAEDRQEP